MKSLSTSNIPSTNIRTNPCIIITSLQPFTTTPILPPNPSITPLIIQHHLLQYTLQRNQTQHIIIPLHLILNLFNSLTV